VRAQAVVVAVALGLAALAWQLHPILALGPLVCPGLPAALMLAATLRHGDPYDVSHRYPPGAHLGRSVSPPE
jgi:hypothetical protein